MKYKRSVYKTLALITQLGLSMLAPVFICVALGAWLEKKYQWPVFIPLLILGILAGCRNTWMLAKSVIRDMEREGGRDTDDSQAPLDDQQDEDQDEEQ